MGNKISKREKILCKNKHNMLYDTTSSDYFKIIHLQFTETKYCNKIYIEYLLKNIRNKVENTGADSDHVYYKVTIYSKEAYKECLQLIKKNSPVLKKIKR